MSSKASSASNSLYEYVSNSQRSKSLHMTINDNDDMIDDDAMDLIGSKRKGAPTTSKPTTTFVKRRFGDDEGDDNDHKIDDEDEEDDVVVHVVPVVSATPSLPDVSANSTAKGKGGRGKRVVANKKALAIPTASSVSSSSSSVEVIDLDDEPAVSNPAADEQIILAQKLLSNITNAKQFLSKPIIATSNSTSTANTSGKGRGKRKAVASAQSTANKEDDESLGIFIPVVKTAAERRIELQHGQSKSIAVTADMFLNSTTQSTSGIDSGPKIKVQTRLNGAHKLTWNLPLSQTFDLFSDRVRITYGLAKPSVITMIFDGLKLSGKDTADSVGIEDECLIDLVIDKALQAGAISFVGDKKFGIDGIAAAAPPAKPIDSSPKLKISSRLNGTHKLSWNIGLQQEFSVFKGRIITTYGLPSDTAITLVFDGNKLSDKDTVTSAEIEEGDLVDIRIPQPLQPIAIEFAKDIKVGCD